jgi:hypothetical protein
MTDATTTDTIVNFMEYSPIFIGAGDIYAATTFDASIIGDFTPSNPIDPKITALIGQDYVISLDDVFGNLALNEKSIDSKDSVANYSLNFDTTADGTDKGHITLTEVTDVPKGVEFGSGNEAVKESITYDNISYGDKLVINHNYSVQTTTDKKDSSIVLSLKESDNMTQKFTAETGANAISSISTRASTHSEDLVQGRTDVLTVKDKLSESLKFKSPTIQIDENHSKTLMSIDDGTNNDISSAETYNVNYINSDKSTDAAYKLNYSLSENVVKDLIITTLNKFSFVDNNISITASGVVAGEDVSKGSLKVTTDNFSLNTKVSLASTFTDILLAGGYGAKDTFDTAFGTETEFKGTDDADYIKINNVKTVVVTTSRGTTSDPVLLSVDAGSGNDTVLGSLGADSLTGGDGEDVFILGNKDSGSIVITSSVTTTNKDGTTIEYEAEATGSDTITDFKGSLTDDQGKIIRGDTLSLGVAGSDANYSEGTEKVDNFSAAFTKANEELTALTVKGEKFSFQFDDVNGYFFDDVNGDGLADQVIVMTGVTNADISAIDIIK